MLLLPYGSKPQRPVYGHCSMTLQVSYAGMFVVVVHVNRVRLCLATVATSGPVVYPPDNT